MGALLLTLSACALPGPPRPRIDIDIDGERLECPHVTLVGLADEGLRIDLHVPRAAAWPGEELVVWRAPGAEAPLEPFQIIVLDEALAARIAAGEPLAFLDAQLPATRPLALAYGLDAPAPPACPFEPLEIELPDRPPAPAAPRVEVLGLVTRIAAPDDATPVARLYRRSIHERAREPVLLEALWDTAEPFVDTALEPGGIYAYSVQNTAALRAEPGHVTIRIAGPAGLEAYAPVRPPDQLIDVDFDTDFDAP